MNKLMLVLVAASALGLSCKAEARDAVLIWTAPGDDGTVGRATAYEIRYKSSAPAGADSVSMAAWLSTSGSIPAPVPSVAGAADSARVTGLDAGRAWYFVIRAADEAGNLGAWSNVAVLSALDVVRPGTIGLTVVPR